MCDFSTVAGGVGSTALSLQGAGGIATTIGSYYAGLGQKTSLQAGASTARMNAALSENAAQSALYAGSRQVQQKEQETTNLASKETANIAANGIDLGSQSAVNTITSTKTMGEIDADTLNANAVRAAWGYRQQGTNFTNQAIEDTATAKTVSPWSMAGASFLNSAGSVASSWYKLNTMGNFGKNTIKWDN